MIEEGKSRNGKEYVRIKGTHEQAEEVRQRFFVEGKKPGVLNKDKYNQGTYYFSINRVQ
ncbi:MAG: hypothetical protein ACOX0T_05980 [Pelotomaculum sp.]